MPSSFVRPTIGAPSTARRPPKHARKQGVHQRVTSLLSEVFEPYAP